MENELQINKILKDLKIISTTQREKCKEDFGILISNIEYLRNNPNTEKIDIAIIFEKALELRDTIRLL